MWHRFGKPQVEKFLPEVGVVSSRVAWFILEIDGLYGHVINSLGLGLMQKIVHAKKGGNFPRIKRGLML